MSPPGRPKGASGPQRDSAEGSSVRDPATDPLRWTIGLVGYGEVGRILAEDLRARGVQDIVACDVKVGTPAAAPLAGHATAYGVTLTAAHAELARAADVIVSAVTASQAVPVARACAPSLRRSMWFLDLNSASPGAKQEAAAIVERAGGRYVEAAVMTSVPPHRIRVPLILGGPHAGAFAPLLSGLGFAPTAGPAELGVASATKMCRSVMIKGLEAMVIESFTAARALGVEGALLASLAETFPGIDWEKQGTYFFQRAVQHGRRRAEEMREVAVTVHEAGLEPWSANGTAARQGWVADLGDAGAFGDSRVLAADWRVYADAILARRAAAAGQH